jgi:hypothetical protein
MPAESDLSDEAPSAWTDPLPRDRVVGPVRRSLAGFFEGLTSVGVVGKIAFGRVETLYVRNLV